MPAKAPKKPRVPSARQQIVSELKVKSKSLNKQLAKVKRDLRSFGVGKKKKKANA